MYFLWAPLARQDMHVETRGFFQVATITIAWDRRVVSDSQLINGTGTCAILSSGSLEWG